MTIHLQAGLERTPVQAAARLLADAKRLLVVAGAGLSADAGVPTFRGEGGWWRQIKAEELATPEAFATSPELIWEWYRQRRRQVATSQPHAGQRALALLEQHHRERVLIATTNEDDLLQRAGVTTVVHLHGELRRTTCVAGCGWMMTESLDHPLTASRCPQCGGLTRPGSTWFGEPLPQAALDTVTAFAPDGMLLIGSSCLVKPVADWPMDLVNQGCPVVEINPEATPISDYVALSLRHKAIDVLPTLVDLLTSYTMRDQARRMA